MSSFHGLVLKLKIIFYLCKSLNNTSNGVFLFLNLLKTVRSCHFIIIVCLETSFGCLDMDQPIYGSNNLNSIKKFQGERLLDTNGNYEL